MSKKIKKIIVGGVVATLLLTLTGGMVFAKDIKQTNSRLKDNVVQTKQCDDDHKVVKKVVLNDIKEEKVLSFVEKYTPDSLEQWNQVFKDKEELKKKVATNIKTKIQESEKIEEAKTYIKDLRTKVENEEMTRKEAVKEIRVKTVEIKKLVKEKIEEWRNENSDTLDNIKENKKEIAKIKAELAKSIKDDNETEIVDNLNKLLAEAESLIDNTELLVSE